MVAPFGGACSLEHDCSGAWCGGTLAVGRRIIFSDEDKPHQHDGKANMKTGEDQDNICQLPEP